MAKIKTLKDKEDNIIYPQTVINAIFVDENNTLDEVLGDIVNTLNRLNDGEGV